MARVVSTEISAQVKKTQCMILPCIEPPPLRLNLGPGVISVGGVAGLIFGLSRESAVAMRCYSPGLSYTETRTVSLLCGVDVVRA